MGLFKGNLERLGGGIGTRGPGESQIETDRRLVQLLVDTAEELGISYQFKQPLMGGTDAGAIHKTRTGVPSAVVSVPARYIHSPVCVLSKSDFENTVRLMQETLRRLTPAILGAL